MLPGIRLLKDFWHYSLQRTATPCYGVVHLVDGMSFSLFNGFCNIGESPELPSWVKENLFDANLKDDFVLPTNGESLSDWVGYSSAHPHETGVRNMGHRIADTNIDRISRLLKGRFASPEAVVQALDHCDVDVSQSLSEKILRRFSNNWIPAFGFFRWAEMQMGYKHSIDSYNTMVDILGKSKQFDIMWRFVEQISQSGSPISLVTMSKIMRRLAGAGRWADAIGTFHEMERFGVNKDTSAMNVLLDTLSKERHVEHARDVFVELRSWICPNSHSFNILIHGWCRARRLYEAKWTMEEMKSFGFHPCVVTYTSLIEAYCNSKDFCKVDAILDEMHANGCPPNVVTYTIVMHSLGKAKETHEALWIFEKMKKNDCTPDTSFYNSLIYILSKAGRIQDAHDIYHDMLKSGISPNVTTYNTMISAACEHSQEEDALRLLQKMEKNSCKPDIKTYSPLLKMCCRRKKLKTLSYLLNHMFRKDVSLDSGTYSLLVNGLCKNGRLKQSCFFFKHMVSKGLLPKCQIYIMLLEELERKNMRMEKQIIQQLMEHTQTVKQFGSSSVTCLTSD